MKAAMKFVERLCGAAQVLAGVSLTLIVALTMADVVLRAFKRPIPGTYEMVGFLGALAIGLSLPITSWKRGQIYVDSFIARLPAPGRNAFNGATRAMGIVLFVLVGWNLLLYGADLQRSGEVSLTLQLPFYPVVYAVGVCSLFEALVLACDFVKIAGGRYE